MGISKPTLTTTCTTVFVLVLITSTNGYLDNCPPKVTIVEEGTQLEKVLVQQFKENGYNETLVPENGTDYEVSFATDIQAIFLIVPKIKYLNGTVGVYQKGVDFFFEAQNGTATMSFHEVGYYMLTIFTSTTITNTLLNVGMRRRCDTVCQPNGTCKDKGKIQLPQDEINCPPDDGCQLISKDVFDAGHPVFNAVVVRSCDEFVDAVCNKFEAKEGKVDVFFDGHGNNGLFSVNGDCVEKGSACYNKICEKLKDKIKTLTLYSCKTAGGAVGKVFIQSLANCLKAVVRAWEKILSTPFYQFIPVKITWSTQRGFLDPVEAKPVLNNTSTTPTSIVQFNIPKPTLTPPSLSPSPSGI